jgi:excisionase family DNA binding protein
VPKYTDKPWWTPEEAARVLRVNVHSLYRAIRRGDFPHQRIGMYIKIPAEAMGLTPLPDPIVRRVLKSQERWEQMELPLDPPPVPVRLYRDGTQKRSWDHERALWGLAN